jgi:ceramide glucosyltransferase
VGVNPKVNNLVRSYHQAANDILWVLDSGVSVAPGTLARSVHALVGPYSTSINLKQKQQVALIHHVPFAFTSQCKIGSKLEEAFLNTNHAKMYLAINTIGIESCVIGKSNLYRRSDIERVNGSLKRIPTSEGASQPGECGLAAFGKFLAEDNMIASSLWHELGGRHVLSCDVARNAVGSMSFLDYVWRRKRWIRVRKHMTATLVEPFTECVVVSLIAAACIKHLCGFPIWIFLIIHVVLWLLVDLEVYKSLAGYPVPADQRWQFLGAWAGRELLAFPIWILAIVGDEVIWRGRKYQVLRNGQVRRVTSD